MGGASRRYRCDCTPAAGHGGRCVDSIAVPRNACPAAGCRSKKVRARIGSVPVSLREDAPNGSQRRTTRRLPAGRASPQRP
ncbi:hypothetical protein CFB47_16780 [Burkholderia sp. AU27893]|uniref:Uncharacterized protein n=1 Tax=Burkholderia contaminans TaxID=488447 RepID=A0A2S5E0F2_9BURK|nr:hypothetical protein CFB47_16780 [Burkholderia sp. AU27893]POZ84883.1 hypothetical protein C3743_24745 [Burkholderia contaminans]